MYMNILHFQKHCYILTFKTLIFCALGQTFGGLLEYMKNCNILKIVTHVKFAFSR